MLAHIVAQASTKMNRNKLLVKPVVLVCLALVLQVAHQPVIFAKMVQWLQAMQLHAPCAQLGNTR